MKEQIIEIPKYIRKVQLSKARQAKYYELGKKHPKAKKYQNKKKYEYRVWPGFGKRQFLVDVESGERVIANPRAVGTPNNTVINGQKFYNGEQRDHVRNKVMNEIKNSFVEYIEQLDPITEFPIKLSCEVHDCIREENSNMLWDMDNRFWPYLKAFQDCLTGNRGKNKVIIPDDNILYITQPAIPKFIPIDNHENRKLIFKLEKETDPRILNNKEYINELLKLP